MSWSGDCRRRHPRFPFESTPAEIEFVAPGVGVCRMPLRDLSLAGLSFVLEHELPGLAIGDNIDGVRLHVEGQVIHGDALVMRLSPGAMQGAVCGALFYPDADQDLLRLRAVMQALQASFAGAGVATF